MPSPRTTARSSACSSGACGSCNCPSSVTTTPGSPAMGSKRSAADEHWCEELERRVGAMSAVPAPDTGPDAGAVWHYGDPFGEQRAAMDEAVVVDRSHRVVLTLTGGDRKSWLHNDLHPACQ